LEALHAFVLYQGTTSLMPKSRVCRRLQTLRQNFCFVSGHDFSHAEKPCLPQASDAAAKTLFCIRARLQSCRKPSFAGGFSPWLSLRGPRCLFQHPLNPLAFAHQKPAPSGSRRDAKKYLVCRGLQTLRKNFLFCIRARLQSCRKPVSAAGFSPWLSLRDPRSSFFQHPLNPLAFAHQKPAPSGSRMGPKSTSFAAGFRRCGKTFVLYQGTTSVVPKASFAAGLQPLAFSSRPHIL
jgi:hypothetical protein